MLYRQWKKQPEKTLNTEYLKNKQFVYRLLFEKVEDVHIKLRTEPAARRRFGHLIREINSFILTNQLFLEEIDRQETTDYLNDIYEFASILATSEDAKVKESWRNTASIDWSVVEDAKEIKRRETNLERKRNKLIERFKRNIGS